MDQAQRRQLERYAAMLGAAPLNLVARGDRDDVWGRHVAEAVAVVETLAPAATSRWLDLGTGGGLPGVVLAVLRPDVHVTLVDARGKKIRAVAAFVEELGLTNAATLQGRAEHLARDPAHREGYDGVVSRALGRLGVAAELSRGFVSRGGTVAVVRGDDADEELERLAASLPQMGLSRARRLGIGAAPRVTNLVTMRAEGSAPAWLPRADGIPQSSPIDGPPSEG